MRAGLITGLLLGVALAVGLVLYFGLDDIGRALASAGWRGLAAIVVVHAVTLVLCGWAWQVLLVGTPPRHAYLVFFWARWLRDSVSNLFGFVPGAGELAGARELTLRGVPVGVAGATAVVDATTELLGQLLFTLLGVAVLVADHPNLSSTWWATGGLVIATLAIGGFVVAQRNGLFRFLESLPQRLGLIQPRENPSETESIHAAIQDIYDRRGIVAASVALHLLAWIVGTAEAWIALHLMGHPLAPMDVITLEALVFALRAAAFVVPSAIGVQEGGYVAIGAIFGLSPDVALALSLLKRAREIATGVPALAAVQAIEGRKLWSDWTRARSEAKPEMPPSKSS